VVSDGAPLVGGELPRLLRHRCSPLCLVSSMVAREHRQPTTRAGRTVRVRSDNFRAGPAIAVARARALFRIRSMVSVGIPALSGTASIGTAGLMDALNKADLAEALLTGQPALRVFDVRLTGLSEHPVMCRDGVSLHPSEVADNVTAPDLVVV